MSAILVLAWHPVSEGQGFAVDCIAVHLRPTNSALNQKTKQWTC